MLSDGRSFCLPLTAICLVLSVFPAFSQQVRVTEDQPEVRIETSGEPWIITRDQDQTAVITGEYARIARACPPDCVLPMVPIPGIAPYGEVEVITFLQEVAATGGGALIDARTPEVFAQGSIPGAVNVPHATLSATNPFRNDILVALGARPIGGNDFDYSDVIDLVVFGDGPWSDSAVRALRSLQGAGYPSEKPKFYRGGMQDWMMLGLTVSQPGGVGEAGGKP